MMALTERLAGRTMQGASGVAEDSLEAGDAALGEPEDAAEND